MNKSIIIAICLIISFATGMGLDFPQYQRVKAKYFELEAKQTEIENAKNYYNKLASVAGEIQKYSEAILKIDSALPDEISYSEIFDFFQKSASDSGLILKDVGQISESQKTASDTKEYGVELTLSGSYSNFKNFLYNMEKSAKLIEVTEVSFSSPEKNGSPFLFAISVKFYSH